MDGQNNDDQHDDIDDNYNSCDNKKLSEAYIKQKKGIKNYYEKNKDKILEYNKKYYSEQKQKYPDHVKKTRQAYYKKNKDRICEYAKEYAKENKEKIRGQRVVYYKKRVDDFRKYGRKYYRKKNLKKLLVELDLPVPPNLNFLNEDELIAVENGVRESKGMKLVKSHDERADKKLVLKEEKDIEE